jgi:hypothetical protein
MRPGDHMLACKECDRLLAGFKSAAKAYSRQAMALSADLSRFAILLVAVKQAKLSCDTAKENYDLHKLSHAAVADQAA